MKTKATPRQAMAHGVRTPDVRRATTADAAQVARTLASAFSDDPVFEWCIPNVERRRQVLPGFFETLTSALLAHDEVHLDAASRATALWVPPGVPAVDPDEAPAFEERLGVLLGRDGERTFQIVELLESNHPTEPHHYLWFVGVRADARGQGLGTALLEPMLDHCDRLGSPAYLEATSPDNRRLYERLGFEVTNEISVAGSPPLWPMWRAPGA